MDDSREEIQKTRRQLKERYAGLYDEILEILFKHDPMELDYQTNSDEYDPEVMAVLPRLHEARSAEHVEEDTGRRIHPPLLFRR